jgi:hypothetical protein
MQVRRKSQNSKKIKIKIKKKISIKEPSPPKK